MRKLPCMLYQIWMALNGKKLTINVCLEKEASDMFHWRVQEPSRGSQKLS